jgi:hypothetical protein
MAASVSGSPPPPPEGVPLAEKEGDIKGLALDDMLVRRVDLGDLKSLRARISFSYSSTWRCKTSIASVSFTVREQKGKRDLSIIITRRTIL